MDEAEGGFTGEVEVQVAADAGASADAAAALVAECAAAAIAARGRFLIALSGGATPRGLFERLAGPPWRERIDWRRCHVFWSDERAVPPDHPDSNYRMAREALLDHVPIPPDQVHRIHGEDDPDAEAAAYEQTLRASVAVGGLDLVLLGLGRDGHTASLFPAGPAGRETARWVVADVDPGGRARVTLTPPAINAARAVAFLVTGADKAETLRAVHSGPFTPDLLPAQRISPRRGRLVWLLDRAAAASVAAPGH